MRVKISEAADALGVSQDTIRRRIKRGEIVAEKVLENNVPTWYVEIPDSIERPPDADAYARRYVELMEEQLAEVKRDRDRWRDMALHMASHRTPVYEAIPLPSGPVERGEEDLPAPIPWWRRWLLGE